MKIPAIPGFDPQAFEKYFKNTSWLMFGKILSMVIGFIIARYLGPYSFGDLSFATAFTGIFAAVSTLGLDSFIIREIIHDPQSKDEILGTSFWMRLSISILIIPLTLIVYLIFRDPQTESSASMPALIALCATASLFKSFNIIDSYFQSQVQSKFVVQVQNICLVISALIKVVIVWLNLPVVYFALALVIDGVLLALGLVLIYHKKGLSLFRWKFNRSRAVSLISVSWPLIFSAVMVSVYMYIDQVMLKAIGGSKPVGIYSAAAKISEAWYFIPVAIVTSVFPAIINARQTDTLRYHKRLQDLYDLLIVITLPIAVIISFLADDIIALLYGNQYEGAGIMLSIHIWSGVFVFLGSASNQYLLAEGFTLISFIRAAVGALVNILLNIWLIPLYGGVGASIATLVAYAIPVIFILFIPKTRKQGIMLLQSLFLISISRKIVNFLK